MLSFQVPLKLSLGAAGACARVVLPRLRIRSARIATAARNRWFMFAPRDQSVCEDDAITNFWACLFRFAGLAGCGKDFVSGSVEGPGLKPSNVSDFIRGAEAPRSRRRA